MHLGCRKLSRKLEIFSKSNFTKHRDNQEQKSLRLPSFTPSSPISRLKHRCGLVQIPSSTFSTLILGKGSPENSFFTFSLTIFAPDCSFYVSFWFLILKVSSNSLQRELQRECGNDISKRKLQIQKKAVLKKENTFVS